MPYLSPLILAFLVYGTAPKTVPSKSPAITKSAGALAALRNSAIIVPVIVRLPDAPWKRGSTGDCVLHSKVGQPSRQIHAPGSLRDPDGQ